MIEVRTIVLMSFFWSMFGCFARMTLNANNYRDPLILCRNFSFYKSQNILFENGSND